MDINFWSALCLILVAVQVSGNMIYDNGLIFIFASFAMSLVSDIITGYNEEIDIKRFENIINNTPQKEED